jgi:hypothetical protein
MRDTRAYEREANTKNGLKRFSRETDQKQFTQPDPAGTAPPTTAAHSTDYEREQ